MPGTNLEEEEQDSSKPALEEVKTDITCILAWDFGS